MPGGILSYGRAKSSSAASSGANRSALLKDIDYGSGVDACVANRNWPPVVSIRLRESSKGRGNRGVEPCLDSNSSRSVLAWLT